MIKIIRRTIYSAFISIVLLSIILTGWTGYAFIFQPTKSSELISLIQGIYESQKTVIIDVVDLSKLLITDTSKENAYERNNLLQESESESVFLTDQEDKSLFDEPSILEDNGDNPLGIVIESSLPEVSEENLPEVSVGPLDSDQSEVSMNEIEIGMDMN